MGKSPGLLQAPALTLLPVASTAPTETNDSQFGTSSVTRIAVSLVICLLPAPPLQAAALPESETASVPLIRIPRPWQKSNTQGLGHSNNLFDAHQEKYACAAL